MLVAVKSMLQLIIMLYRQLFECVISLSDCSVTDLCLIQYIFHFSFYVVVSFSFSFSFFFGGGGEFILCFSCYTCMLFLLVMMT